MKKNKLTVLPNKGKFAISAASLKVSSCIHAIRTYPNKVPTISIDLTSEDARSLALMLLMVAEAPVDGIIHLTGHGKTKQVTVLRRRK